MVTASEAFYAVRDGKKIPVVKDDNTLIGKVCQLICSHINHGWLGINLANKVEGNLLSVRQYLENLGYIVDKDYGVYWMFDPIIQSKRSTKVQ